MLKHLENMLKHLEKKSLLIIICFFFPIILIFSIIWIILGNFFPIEIHFTLNSLKFKFLIICIIIFSIRCLFLILLNYNRTNNAMLFVNEWNDSLSNISNMFTLNVMISYLFNIFNMFNSQKHRAISINRWFIFRFKIGKYFSKIEKYFLSYVFRKTKELTLKKSIMLAFYQLKIYIIHVLFLYDITFLQKVYKTVYYGCFIPQIIPCSILLYEILYKKEIILTYYFSYILIVPIMLYCLQKILFVLSSYQLGWLGNRVVPEISLYGNIVYTKISDDVELHDLMCENYETYFFSKTLMEIFYELTDEIAFSKEIVVNMLLLFSFIIWVYNIIIS